MNKEKVVVTGINGFVGSHLARELYDNGLSVIGVGHETKINPNISNLVGEYYQVNLIENWPNIPDVKAVINLAGLASVGPSFNEPQTYITANSSIVTNLCEFYLKQNKRPRIIIVSSGAIYDSSQPMPITESGAIDFSSPYSVSKILNENQAAYYRNRGLDCVIIRPFNHIGPGQGLGFILPDLYERLSSLKRGEHKIITGDIETKRDYTDVRDIARAYCKLALSKTLQHSVYNLCRGTGVSGSEIFNELKSVMKMNNVGYKIDQSLVRPTDAKSIVGDSSRLRDELSWKPQIALHRTIVDFVKSKSF